jgi:glycosyltransferase XagB
MTDPSSIDPESAAYAKYHGQQCAQVRWSAFQITLAIVLPFGLAALVIQAPAQGWVMVSTVVALLSASTLGLRLIAMALSVQHDPSINVPTVAQSSAERDALPRYAILVPLYREPEVVPDLLRALIAIDYPTDRIDIHILLEEDDALTRDAFAAQDLPNHLRITTAPPGLPRTKPRACNVGLRACDADLLVIYDAEDRPDTNQLLCAALAYRDLPDSVVCLQCRLDHYNSQQSLPARWTSIDYLLWFRLVLPGLQRLGAPIPLGGTSNHFRVAALRELGGWDPFNVTEDCDLDMRIARRG